MTRLRAAAAPVLLAGFLLAAVVPPIFLLQLGAGLALLAGLTASLAAEVTAPAVAFLAVTSPGLTRLASLPESVPWGILFVAGFCAGGAFRKGSAGPRRRPRPIGQAAVACVLLWTLAAAAGIAQARSIWAWRRGLTLRVVNVFGTLDASAISGTILSLAAVLTGWFLYRAARDFPRNARSGMLLGAAAGAAVSGVAAALQARGLLADPRNGYWKLIGRHQGLCGDPNALGIACALSLAVALSALWRGTPRLIPAIGAVAASGAGLMLSGSRSGLLLVGAAFAMDAATLWRRPGRFLRPVLVLAAATAIGAVLLAAHRRGSAGQRLFETFNPRVPLAYRASARPALWAAAWQGFRSDPIAGIGWNGYWWNLPNIAAASRSGLMTQDNPGSFYLQVLCETGLTGAVLFGLFAGTVLRRAGRSARDRRSRASPGPAVIGLFAALAGGSHLLAPEVAAIFFLLLASLPDPPKARPSGAATAGRLLLLVLACAAWTVLAFRTDSADYAFRYSDRIGFWSLENPPDGPFRWMSARAAVREPAGESRIAELTWPGPGDEAILVRSGTGAPIRIGLPPGQSRALRLDGGSHGAVFTISSERSSRPASAGDSDDARELSVRWRERPPE